MKKIFEIVFVYLIGVIFLLTLAFRVQENIKSSVESMTEFKVNSVNVHVVGVSFNDVDSDFVS